MERLTKKILPEWGMHYNPKSGVSLAQFNNKLGQLEDIEEEVGCSIEILREFKTLKDFYPPFKDFLKKMFEDGYNGDLKHIKEWLDG